MVEKQSYLLELSRYVVLNRARAWMVRNAEEWPWSNFRATAGLVPAPRWLDTEWALSAFAEESQQAPEAYRHFVAQGKNQPSPWEHLKNQIYLGSEAFVQEAQAHVDGNRRLSEVPRSQRRPVAKPLTWYFTRYRNRDEAIFAAFGSGAYSMQEIGDYVGLHYSTISRIVAMMERSQTRPDHDSARG